MSHVNLFLLRLESAIHQESELNQPWSNIIWSGSLDVVSIGIHGNAGLNLEDAETGVYRMSKSVKSDSVLSDSLDKRSNLEQQVTDLTSDKDSWCL